MARAANGHFPARRAAPVAQLDRAPDYESGGQEFESLRARHLSILLARIGRIRGSCKLGISEAKAFLRATVRVCPEPKMFLWASNRKPVTGGPISLRLAGQHDQSRTKTMRRSNDPIKIG